MADTKLSDSERFSIRIASEARAFVNGDLIEEPYTRKWVPNPERVGVLDRIEEDVRAEAQLLQTVRSAYVHMVNNNFLRDIQRQLNSPSIQSAIKSFQAEARIVWPNAESPQSKLMYRVEPTHPTVERRSSGIAVVSHNVLVIQLPDKPPLPDVEGWDAVFNWYYQAPKYICENLLTLSKLIGYSHGTVRNKEQEYKAQFGKYPINIQH